MEPGEELLVRREVHARGQSRCFIDDSPVTLAILKLVAEHLVDLHGQHEHQSLLHTGTHITMLDDVGGLDGMVAEFQTALARLRALAAQLDDLRRRERQLMEKRELYTFQAWEIDEVGPSAGEEGELETERNILENAEKLYDAILRLHQILYEGDQAVHDLLVTARNQLEGRSMGGTGQQGRRRTPKHRLTLPVVRRLGVVLAVYLSLCAGVIAIHSYGTRSMAGAREELSREVRAIEQLVLYSRTRDEAGRRAYLHALASTLPRGKAQAHRSGGDPDPAALYGVFSSTRPDIWPLGLSQHILALVIATERVHTLAKAWRQTIRAIDKVEVAAAASGGVARAPERGAMSGGR